MAEAAAAPAEVSPAAPRRRLGAGTGLPRARRSGEPGGAASEAAAAPWLPGDTAAASLFPSLFGGNYISQHPLRRRLPALPPRRARGVLGSVSSAYPCGRARGGAGPRGRAGKGGSEPGRARCMPGARGTGPSEAARVRGGCCRCSLPAGVVGLPQRGLCLFFPTCELSLSTFKH